MKPQVEFARLEHMRSIKRHECPKCRSILEKSSSPGGATGSGTKKPPSTYWDFYCKNKKCKKVWRVPRALYEATFGEWLK
jgi:hypothetical protein